MTKRGKSFAYPLSTTRRFQLAVAIGCAPATVAAALRGEMPLRASLRERVRDTFAAEGLSHLLPPDESAPTQEKSQQKPAPGPSADRSQRPSTQPSPGKAA